MAAVLARVANEREAGRHVALGGGLRAESVGKRELGVDRGGDARRPLDDPDARPHATFSSTDAPSREAAPTSDTAMPTRITAAPVMRSAPSRSPLT